MQVDGVEEIKTEIKNFFKAKFEVSCVSRLVLDGVEFNKLSEDDRDGLEEEFSDEEIR